MAVMLSDFRKKVNNLPECFLRLSAWMRGRLGQAQHDGQCYAPPCPPSLLGLPQ